MSRIPRTLSPSIMDAEDVVAKLHFLEHLESRWPYAPARERGLIERISNCLTFIPDEFHDAALAIFANTVYLPEPLLRDTWTFLGDEAATHLGYESKSALFDAAHLLEVDPSGLIPVFLHENEVDGRLDTDRFSRLQSVAELTNALKLVALSSIPDVSTVHSIKLAFERPVWLLLADNNLSGTSASSDATRASELIAAYGALGTPRLTSLSQVLTSAAATVMRAHVHSIGGVTFDDSYRVLPDNHDCRFFASKELHHQATLLCQWLSDQEWFSGDSRLKATIATSGDGMAFGFRGGGWTIVTPNCPTNSLPLLWYNQPGRYEGPYPRVLSRTTQAKSAAGQHTMEAVAFAGIVLEKIHGVENDHAH